jgi:TolA-binding protein
MYRMRLLVVLIVLVGVCSPWAGGQDKTKDAKQRGQLPANWGKLGLTDEQKQRVYKIQNSYRPKIDALQQKIDDLRESQRKDMESVLDNAQRSRLRDILSGKAPRDTKDK